MKSFKVEEIKEVIKSLLKKNGFKYKDLADFLDCSEPTIKRILGSEELSLTRLLRICEYLKMSLSDLESLIQKEEKDKVYFSEKQQKFLVENKSYFAYLFEIYQGLTPDQIALKYKLTAKSTQKYLIQLEKYDLIKVSGKNRISPYHPHFPVLSDGPLGLAYYRSLIDNGGAFLKDRVAEDIASRSFVGAGQKKLGGSVFAVNVTDVSIETFKQAMQEIELRIKELDRQGRFEEKSKGKEDLKTGVIIFGSTLVEPNYKGLQTLHQSFGLVENL